MLIQVMVCLFLMHGLVQKDNVLMPHVVKPLLYMTFPQRVLIICFVTGYIDQHLFVPLDLWNIYFYKIY